MEPRPRFTTLLYGRHKHFTATLIMSLYMLRHLQLLVMPAWIAGIRARTDVSGDIHLNLDSSTPCWNDARDSAQGIETSARNCLRCGGFQ